MVPFKSDTLKCLSYPAKSQTSETNTVPEYQYIKLHNRGQRWMKIRYKSCLLGDKAQSPDSSTADIEQLQVAGSSICNTDKTAAAQTLFLSFLSQLISLFQLHWAALALCFLSNLSAIQASSLSLSGCPFCYCCLIPHCLNDS